MPYPLLLLTWPRLIKTNKPNNVPLKALDLTSMTLSAKNVWVTRKKRKLPGLHTSKTHAKQKKLSKKTSITAWTHTLTWQTLPNRSKLLGVQEGHGGPPGYYLATGLLMLWPVTLLLGLADTTGKYLAPDFGEFFFYVAVIAIVYVFPHGLFGKAQS